MEKEQLNSQDEDIKPEERNTSETTAGQEIPAPIHLEPTSIETETLHPKGKSFWQKTMPWVAAVLLSLIIGAALVIFLLYIPADSAHWQSQSDLTSAKSALELSQTKAEGLQNSLTDTTNQLDTANAALESANLSLMVARLQSNISYARLALVNKDTLTARQELSDADANLAELTLLLNDSETASALADRLKTIRATLTNDPSKALDEMRTLSENLARLENR